MKAIALNADEETSYELFGADEEQIDDIEMLYRAMYHKIGNESEKGAELYVRTGNSSRSLSVPEIYDYL